MLVSVLMAAVCGALAGGAAGFVAAVVQLGLKRLRNAIRIRRGQPPFRDCVLVPLHRSGAVQGLLVGGTAGAFASLAVATVLAAAGLPGLFILQAGAINARQAFSREPHE